MILAFDRGISGIMVKVANVIAQKSKYFYVKTIENGITVQPRKRDRQYVFVTL